VKSFNIKYTNLENLGIFKSIYNIKNYKNILLHIFTSICKENFIVELVENIKNLIVARRLARDNEVFMQTIVFTQDKIIQSGVVVALLFNDGLIAHTQASFGWENIGKTMQITKSKKNVVYEIDNIKAIDIYAKYLGEDIANLLPQSSIEFPLIVKKDNLYVPRSVIGKNSDDSLIFAANLKEREGYFWLRQCRCNFRI